MNVKDKSIKLSEAQFQRCLTRRIRFSAEPCLWLVVLVPLQRSFLPRGFNPYKPGLCFCMCRVTVLIPEHFQGEEAKGPCRGLDLNAQFCVKLWLKSWLCSKRCLSFSWPHLLFLMFVSWDSQRAGLFDKKYLVFCGTGKTHRKKRGVQLISIRNVKNQPCHILLGFVSFCISSIKNHHGSGVRGVT